MFSVAAEAYDRFMGRYSRLLSAQLCDLAGIAAGQRVLDVGCGPGTLTGELVARVGAASVAAVEPSEPFVAAVRERHPGVDIRLGPAEDIPFPDASFDAALAQLVVHFMADPRAGVGEMRRVTKEGGVLVACVWDHGSGRGPLSPLWEVAEELDPAVDAERSLVGSNPGDLHVLFENVGLDDVDETVTVVRVEHPTFDDWWEPYTVAVGTAGTYVAGLDEAHRAALRERCHARLGDGPFVLEARAWTARGVVPG